MTAFQKTKYYLEEIKKNDQKGKKMNAFLQINPYALEQAKAVDEKIKSGQAGKLAGYVIAVKSNINVKGLNASCASLTLKDYTSPYNATVIKKLKDEDAVIIGMTNMDEFACGSSGETSAFKPTKNPAALDLIPGGSSSGSAAAVAAGFCDAALGSDTGGSIRNPTSHCGVIGLKPSYGLVSRYGLIDLAMSFDQIGPITKKINDAALLLDIIKGRDEYDPTTFLSDKIKLNKPKKIIIGIPELKINNNQIQNLINNKINKTCKKLGWRIIKIKLKHIDLAVKTYYPIVYVEFFSGTRRFDGRRYGKKIEDVCGPEVIRRILGGSEISKAEYKGKYYRTALKIKQLIKQEFEKAFKKVDCIIMPTVPKLPHKLGSKISVQEMYEYDALTVPANLAEICAVSIPAGKISNIPVGMQIMCPHLAENKMLSIAREFEEI